MANRSLSPSEVIALDIARADMHYVTTSVIGLMSSPAAGEMALIQYGVMAAYETQLHFRRTLGWQLEANWDVAVAKSARMSGKFFADTQRNLDGVIEHFDELLQANRGGFFPPDRRGRMFDFLRDDLSFAMLDGRPYAGLVSAHYLGGLSAAQVADTTTVGPVFRRLSKGVGNIAAAILDESGIARHGHGAELSLQWFDAKSKVALPRLFAGELDSPTAAALMTIHSICLSAMNSAHRALCHWCEQAAQKHQFVALFQSLTAISILRESRTETPQSVGMMQFLDEPESTWVLSQSKLRNGLIHLGLQDIASNLPPGSRVDDAYFAYTGEDGEGVARRVERHLTRFVGELTDWMLAPTARGRTFLRALHAARIE